MILAEAGADGRDPGSKPALVRIIQEDLVYTYATRGTLGCNTIRPAGR